MSLNPRLQILLPDAARAADANKTQSVLIHESPNGRSAQVEPLAHFLDGEKLVCRCVHALTGDRGGPVPALRLSNMDTAVVFLRLSRRVRQCFGKAEAGDFLAHVCDLLDHTP